MADVEEEAGEKAVEGGEGAENVERRCRVRHAYHGQSELEVTILKGEEVSVVDDSDPDWYRIRTSDGQDGFVPSSYLRLPRTANGKEDAVEEKEKKKKKKKKETKDSKQAVAEWCSTWNDPNKNQPRKKPSRAEYVARKKLESLPPGLVIERLKEMKAKGKMAMEDAIEIDLGEDNPDAAPRSLDEAEVQFLPDETGKVLQEYLDRESVGPSSARVAPPPGELLGKDDHFQEFLDGASKAELKDRLECMIASVDSNKWKRGNFVVAVVASNLTFEHLVELDILARGLIKAAAVRGTLEALLHIFIEIEVRNTEDPKLMFRSNSLVTKALGEFLWITGEKYLESLLQPIVFSAVHGPQNFEVNPKIVKDEKQLQENQQNLVASLEMTISKICRSVNRVPPFIRRVCQRIAEVVAMKFEPHISVDELESAELIKRDSVRIALSNFFLLRFICPAIIDPVTFKVWKKPTPIPPKSRVGLLYVAKAVQTASQGGASGKGKSSNAECLNAVITREKDNLLRSVAEIANANANSDESFSDSEDPSSPASSSSSIPMKSSRSDINSRITRRMHSSSALLKEKEDKKEEGKRKEKEEDEEFLIFVETLSQFRKPITEGVKMLDPDWLPVLREFYAIMDKWMKM